MFSRILKKILGCVPNKAQPESGLSHHVTNSWIRFKHNFEDACTDMSTRNISPIFLENTKYFCMDKKKW